MKYAIVSLLSVGVGTIILELLWPTGLDIFDFAIHVTTLGLVGMIYEEVKDKDKDA